MMGRINACCAESGPERERGRADQRERERQSRGEGGPLEGVQRAAHPEPALGLDSLWPCSSVGCGLWTIWLLQQMDLFLCCCCILDYGSPPIQLCCSISMQERGS